MPELPEVANFRKYADASLIHKKVVKIAFGDSKPLQQSQKLILDALIDQEFTSTQQLGKYLFIKNDTGKWLVLHFGMSGSLDFSALEELPKHAVISFYFKDHTHFSYVCPRKFGKVWIADSVEEFKKTHNIGPHALALSKSEFLNLMEKEAGGIKSVLMDQHKISGIGNLYADEILFQSLIHPKTKVSNLINKELETVYSNISKVLAKAIQIIAKGKETPETWLKAHRRVGASCPDCTGIIKKIQVSGRSTYFCDGCQTERT